MSCYNRAVALFVCTVGLMSRHAAGFWTPMSTFFFACQYPATEDQRSLDTGDVALAVHIADNPQYYVPHQIYTISVTSSHTFNGFQLMGFAAMPTGGGGGSVVSGNGGGGPAFFNCSVVHNYMSPMPQHQLSFLWKAPPEGMGCVSFLATAQLGAEVLFKDMAVRELCEEGAVAVAARPSLAALHEHGLVFRDDFDSSTDGMLDATLWDDSLGTEVGNTCGIIQHGSSATFCHGNGRRMLTTVALNTTTASMIQFALGSGSCEPSYSTPPVVISYATDQCTNWTAIEKVGIFPDPTIHLVPLPPAARGPDTCLQWQQADSAPGQEQHGCWAMDNVLVVNVAHPPANLIDTFDPTDPTNWLFFPGGTIQQSCQSDKYAMVFTDSNAYNTLTSRDLDLDLPLQSSAILQQGFEDDAWDGWDIKGGNSSSDCGTIHQGLSLYMRGPTRTRQVCTPYADLRHAASVRFRLAAGTELCPAPHDVESRVYVYVENQRGHTEFITALQLDMYKIPGAVSLPLPPAACMNQARVCWTQKKHGGQDTDIWMIDDIVIVSMETRPLNDVYIQFSLNLACGIPQANFSVSLEYSTNHGQHWHALVQQCIPGLCAANPQYETSEYPAATAQGWQHHTLRLPLGARSPYTRFRWRQIGVAQNTSWAIDNVFIGDCPEGCSGHGACSLDGCYCDLGYSGLLCEESLSPLPTMMVTSLETTSAVRAHFRERRGVNRGYQCGVVATGKPLVFDGAGERQISTTDLNTTSIRFLQFGIRLGSGSTGGSCPGPEHMSEAVILQYTCNGGLDWVVLRRLQGQLYSTPRSWYCRADRCSFAEQWKREAVENRINELIPLEIHLITVPLPPEAQGPVCRFRWWQPRHAGKGRSIWALDDVALTAQLYNILDVDFADPKDISQSLDIHKGQVRPYCGRQHTLNFQWNEEPSELRYVTTTAIGVGPSTVLEFDLNMGCGRRPNIATDNQVYLEFSTDHGLSWRLLSQGCSPPHVCSTYHQSTVYSAADYPTWRRVVIPLPSKTWSQSTRFRWQQVSWSQDDEWSLSNLYIGQQCPEMCGGHGRCHLAQCLCDHGYSGPRCRTMGPLPGRLHTDFRLSSALAADWHTILGGQLVSSNEGCGVILAAESMYFDGAGSRLLVTRDLDLRAADFVQFYLRIGGSNTVACTGSDHPSEGVLLQCTTDGGASWHAITLLDPDSYRDASAVYVELPVACRQPVVKIRWWQPSHSGPETDQWALDEVFIGHQAPLPVDQQNMEASDAPWTSGTLWLVVTEGMASHYCQSTGKALVLADIRTDKFAITKDLQLQHGDVIQFQISVGCSQIFEPNRPVFLQYSTDGGANWWLVEEPCYPGQSCPEGFTEGTRYHSGPYGAWRIVVVTVPPIIQNRPLRLRWWQQGGSTTGFALDNVMIGPACPEMCRGQGICRQGRCYCNEGFQEPSCRTKAPPPPFLLERFEDVSHPGQHWTSLRGGRLGRGCGELAEGSALYFGDEGTREVITTPVNTTSIRLLQFAVRLGSRGTNPTCLEAQDEAESIILDFSTDNGITWQLLKLLEPRLLRGETSHLHVPLPQEAKDVGVVFRWWQPLRATGERRAQWALDDVVLAANDTKALGFTETFDPTQSSVWYKVINGITTLACGARHNALEFSKRGNTRYAETWDFSLTSSTLLQFDLAMGCSGTHSDLYSIALQYSTDLGRSWRALTEECLPPETDCRGFHAGSVYSSQDHTNWTRVTVELPPEAVTRQTRLRWLQSEVSLRGNVWALDNIYLGEGCPWRCSGHGRCHRGVCSCDKGYHGAHCVPSVRLATSQRDTFDHVPSPVLWPEIYGAEISHVCDTLVAGTALVFFREDIRMIVSRDLDLSTATSVQFHFRFGCIGFPSWPVEHSVLLQYSSNGGITWNTIEVIHAHHDTQDIRFYSLALPPGAKTNSTRIRFWQPTHHGIMTSVWAIDDFFVGGEVMSQFNMIYETFDAAPFESDWIFWPGGEIKQFCHMNTDSSTLLAGSSSLVFQQRGSGARSITTRSLVVNELTVIQFEINIGCGSDASADYPVRLEYSTDGGIHWQLVVPTCSHHRTEDTCADIMADPTVYFAGTSALWRRIIVPLYGTGVCGSVSFRWTQGFIPNGAEATTWALDNVYIGAGCLGDCGGHGSCINGLLCQCDEGYGGDQCAPIQHNPRFLKEDFTGHHVSTPHPGRPWRVVSGGQRSKMCGELLEGKAMYFAMDGERRLETQDMDLTNARLVQFFIKLGCESRVAIPSTEPVLVQYSTSGGLRWHTLETLLFGSESHEPHYIALQLPEQARKKSTRIRWWQPTSSGMYREAWAIDQIYIGGYSSGRHSVYEDWSEDVSDTWLLAPGSILQPVCANPLPVRHFIGNPRYLITSDVYVGEGTFLQFYISMGCKNTGICYNVTLEYSLDLGRTWSLLQPACYPSDLDCTVYQPSSVLSADVYYGWNRVTMAIPEQAWAHETRFRWQQTNSLTSSATWALTQIYIGDACPKGCSGHGRCDGVNCRCDSGWSGSTCDSRTGYMSPQLRDTFTGQPNNDNWLHMNGGQLTHDCGVMASGKALHFNGECTRQLISRDLDLRSAMFIQFYFRFGCFSPPEYIDQSVLLDVSTDGGITWQNIYELSHDRYEESTFVVVEIPSWAQVVGTRLRWWQPTHGGPFSADWALDNVLVGGNKSNPLLLQDGFAASEQDAFYWLQHDNAEPGAYCGSDTALTGMSSADENVTLTTTDMQVRRNYILQFAIAVGCGGHEEASPVYLQYSTDRGMSWHPLTDRCLPHQRGPCQGVASMPSVYYSQEGWHRYTVPLKGESVSRATRFRWLQMPSSILSEPQHQWALDDVYIGPSCPGMCGGHGICKFPECVCDKGYMGPACQFVIPTNKHFLKSSSPSPIDTEKWARLQGMGEPMCGITDGIPGIEFSGSGPRILETVDLDLSNARFIQYTLVVGGASESCRPPHSKEEDIILEYSLNGGVTWELLYALDAEYYWQSSRHDYIILPPEARTVSTRVRWWQMVSPGVTRVPWSLRNIFIGGSAINPSALYENFNIPLNEALVAPGTGPGQPWGFQELGQHELTFGERMDPVMSWPESNYSKYIETNQMIIQTDYMIQFKVIVLSPNDDACTPDAGVHLEFNTDPLQDSWSLVQPHCHLEGDQDLRLCQPYRYQLPSVYSGDQHPSWTRVTLKLHTPMYSSMSRFRWRQSSVAPSSPAWALDDVYIGEACPELCRGRGDCVHGVCHCDKGTIGETCQPVAASLLSHMSESFEAPLKPQHWQEVRGGEPSQGCGQLLPLAFGNSLYFNGCGLRHAITAELDTTKVSTIMYVLQIGSLSHSPTCNVDFTNPSGSKVLLLYSKNKGLNWSLIASHSAADYLNPRRVSFEVPQAARAVGVQFRWWQPNHGGKGQDQWAIDYLQIVMPRQDQLLRNARLRQHRGRPTWGRPRHFGGRTHRFF